MIPEPATTRSLDSNESFEDSFTLPIVGQNAAISLFDNGTNTATIDSTPFRAQITPRQTSDSQFMIRRRSHS